MNAFLKYFLMRKLSVADRQNAAYEAFFENVKSYISYEVDKKLKDFKKDLLEKVKTNNEQAFFVDMKTSDFNDTLKFISEKLPEFKKQLDNIVKKSDDKSQKIKDKIEEKSLKFNLSEKYETVLHAASSLIKALDIARIEINTPEKLLLNKAYQELSDALSALNKK